VYSLTRGSWMDDAGLADTPFHHDLNTDPRHRGHVATIGAAQAHTDSQRRLNSLPAQPV